MSLAISFAAFLLAAPPVGGTVAPHWHPAGLWYVRDAAAGREFVAVDLPAGVRRPAFDHAKLAAALAAASGRPVKADRLPFDHVALADGVRFTAFGSGWRYDPATHAVTPAPEPPGDDLPPLAEFAVSQTSSTDTRVRFRNRRADAVRVEWVAPDGGTKKYHDLAAGAEVDQHTYAGHVWAVSDAAGAVLARFRATAAPGVATVTADTRWEPPYPDRSADGRWEAVVRHGNVSIRDRRDGSTHPLSRDGTPADGYRGQVHWSPDGRWLVAVRTHDGDRRTIPLIEVSPPGELQPRLHQIDYAKPGDTLPWSRPALFDVTERKQVRVDDAPFAEAWGNDRVRWQPDSSAFTVLHNHRGHQRLTLLRVGTDGRVEHLIDERSSTFIDYAHKLFLHPLPDGGWLWASERSGWNHVYRFDATGKVVNAVTAGDWCVRHVERVDDTTMTFTAGGLIAGQDPYHVHSARVNLDGTGLVRLTEGDGTHSLQWSPDGSHYLDTYSRVDAPPVTELRRASDGGLVTGLERGTPPAGWTSPIRFVAPGRDGTTPIHGVIFRPNDFDPAKRYLVVEQVYAGPHSAHVPKAFALGHGVENLTARGFAVVQSDGMGTSHRSKAFHDVCWQNLADAGFPDRIAWLKAAAKDHPWLDLSRVGIYGGSAGGQTAMRALLGHGDFYHVAAAHAGCHDNRMDKVWWNEAWMGYPVGPHYAAQSNATDAGKLRGKLLLTVGLLDRNVDPASTLQVADALVKAGKAFDLVIDPSGSHGETPYLAKRRVAFLARHLLGDGR